ncbi:DnaJ family domain-containing protein [Isoptericola sp. NPDC057391]|uniref:DnaJ family domain-containing protein n=1 Tax=Isoptericola sp. NPDC057391 TaxID=3346117 RepID=UPI00363C9DE1
MFRRRRDDPSDPARRAAQYQVDREIAADEAADPGTETGGADRSAAQPRRRMDDRALWVDTVVDQAIRRGEFDDLPLAGKPIPGLRGTHDPDWWLKNLVEREQITGVLPAAQLRRDDAELDETLDREPEEGRVRAIVEDFNARVVDARRQLLGGPPVVTPTRDVEREVQRWRERRRARGIL